MAASFVSTKAWRRATSSPELDRESFNVLEKNHNVFVFPFSSVGMRGTLNLLDIRRPVI
jgi:hypothetical protein